MRLGRVLLGLAAVGVIAVAFRELGGERWMRTALLREDDADEPEALPDEEPVLGYDGMDRDTLLEWLRDASLDEATLLRMERYEREHQHREPVLEAITDQLTAFG